MRRLVPAGVAVVLGLGAAALGAAAGSIPGPSATIDNFSFTPAELTVARGTTITWINRDDIPHTVTGSDAGAPLRSGALDTDERYAFRFDQPGRFGYFCSLHPHMRGTVIVQ